MRRDEQMAPFVSDLKRSYIFGGISSVAAYASIKVWLILLSYYLLKNNFPILEFFLFQIISKVRRHLLLILWLKYLYIGPGRDEVYQSFGCPPDLQEFYCP